MTDTRSGFGRGALIIFFGGAVLARVTMRTARDVELARQAADLPTARESGAANAFAESARTEVLTPAPRSHRRESEGGLFRRSSAGATSH